MATFAPPETKRAAVLPKEPEHNCPFYGRHLALTNLRPLAGLLIPQSGNQCALITNAYSPCSQKMQGKPIDWKQCPVVAAIRPDPATAPWPFASVCPLCGEHPCRCDDKPRNPLVPPEVQ